MPSDEALLRTAGLGGAAWLDVGRPVNAGYVLKVARELGRPAADVTARLVHLGYQAPDPALAEREPTLVSVNRDGKAPWLTMQERLTLSELQEASRARGLDVDELAARLSALGYDALPATDTILTSAGLNGQPPWRPVGATVGAVEVAHAARVLRLDVAGTARRLASLGFDARQDQAGVALAECNLGATLLGAVPPSFLSAQWVAALANRQRVSPAQAAEQLMLRGHRVIASLPPDYLAAHIPSDRWRGGQRPQRFGGALGAFGNNALLPDVTPSRGQIAAIAVEHGITPARVAEDLAGLGYSVPSHLPDSQVSKDHLIVASLGLNAWSPWLPDDAPVPAGHVLAAVQRDAVRGMREVVAMLSDLGYQVPVSVVSSDDKVLISIDLNGRPPWLPNELPVGVWHLARIAVGMRRDPVDAARRLRELGYEVPELRPRHRSPLADSFVL